MLISASSLDQFNAGFTSTGPASLNHRLYIHIDDGGSYVHKELKLSKSYTPGGLLYFCAECECSNAVRGGEWGEFSPLPLSHPCGAHFFIQTTSNFIL